MTIKIAALYVMSLFYVAAGVNHFRKPDFYLPMMPPYLTSPKFLVALSGVAEIILGLFLLLPVTRAWAAWGVIAMLLVFMAVHVYMYQERHQKFAKVPTWIIVARIPLQAVLIAWAFWFTNN